MLALPLVGFVPNGCYSNLLQGYASKRNLVLPRYVIQIAFHYKYEYLLAFDLFRDSSMKIENTTKALTP